MTSAVIPHATAKDPTSPTPTDLDQAIRARLNEVNGAKHTTETVCAFTRVRGGAQLVHLLAHTERSAGRLFFWAEGHGLIPPAGTTRDCWKVTNENLFSMNRIWHLHFGDGADRKLLLWLVRSEIILLVQTLEEALAEKEAELHAAAAAGSPCRDYDLDVKAILDEKWPQKVQLDEKEPDSLRFSVFQYKPLWFDEPTIDAAEEATFGAHWSKKKGRSVLPEMQWQANILPTPFRPSLPSAVLALSPILVLAQSMSHLYPISRRLQGLPWDSEFLEEVDWADYLLMMSEAKNLASWRSLRPASLPFPAPTQTAPNAVLATPRRFPYTSTGHCVGTYSESDSDDGDVPAADRANQPRPQAASEGTPDGSGSVDGAVSAEGGGDGARDSERAESEDSVSTPSLFFPPPTTLSVARAQRRIIQAEGPVRQCFEQIVAQKGPSYAFKWLRGFRGVDALVDSNAHQGQQQDELDAEGERALERLTRRYQDLAQAEVQEDEEARERAEEAAWQAQMASA